MEAEISRMEVDVGGWTGVEVDGAGCRWVHGSVITVLFNKLTYHSLKLLPFYKGGQRSLKMT